MTLSKKNLKIFFSPNPCEVRPFVSDSLRRFRYRQQFNEPRFLGFGIHAGGIQPHRGQFIDRSFGDSGILMGPCQHALPTGVKQLTGDGLVRSDGGMEGFKNAIHILGSRGFRFVVLKK